MPAIFTLFQPLIIPNEGIYSNIIGDEGGETKYGITSRSYPHLDIKNLSFPAACAILKQDFWDFYHLGDIDSQDVANKIMLFIMNQAPELTGKLVQRAVNHCGGTVVEDGILGTNTIHWINSLPSGWLLDRLRVEGALVYLGIVTSNATQSKFLAGWEKRALS